MKLSVGSLWLIDERGLLLEKGASEHSAAQSRKLERKPRGVAACLRGRRKRSPRKIERRDRDR